MKTRVITAVVALIIFLPFLFLGGNYFLFASIVLSALAIYEVVQITFKKLNISVLLLSLIVVLGIFFRRDVPNETLLLGFLLIVFLLLTEIITSGHKMKLVDMSTVLFLSGYIATGFYALYHLRMMGIWIMFYLLVTIWVTDSFAQIGGMKFGKRKLSPNISPNKSVEGSTIGSMATVIVAIIFHNVINIFPNIFITIAVTLIVSIVGQMGDLIESAYKREYSVKDSGNILPGHGGIFDRFDSVILSAPFLLVILELLK